MKLFASAAVAAALAMSAVSAQAAVSHITFSGNGFANQTGSGSSINATQQVLLNAFFANGGAKPFEIVFAYDDATAKVGGQFAATLVSAKADGLTNLFDGFSAFILTEQASFNPTWDVMHFVLKKTAHGAPTATTEAYFTIVDRQGGLFANASALPLGVIDTAILDQVGVDLRVQNGAYSLFGGGGVAAAEAPPSGGLVPEPSTWAMMLTGFLGAGAMLRRRRTALA